MLKEERQMMILDLLQKNGSVVAAELSQALNVSEDTIRRDLRELADAGKMMRVHGGGLPHSPAGVSFNERLKQSPAAKEAIAHAAAGYIQNGHVVIIDGGTTTLLLAQSLPASLKATVITNSPLIASALADYPDVDIQMVGGRLFKDSRVTTGASTVAAFRDIRADVCFLGICSLHPVVGISVVNLEESYVKQAMIAGSAQVIALASVEKLGTASPYRVAPITALNVLITERDVPDTVITSYLETGVQVQQV